MDYLLGQIALFPFERFPRDWAECNGRLLSVESNIPLFTLIGNRFGGNGVQVFALPDYTELAPPGSRYCICIKGVFPTLRDTGDEPF